MTLNIISFFTPSFGSSSWIYYQLLNEPRWRRESVDSRTDAFLRQRYLLLYLGLIAAEDNENEESYNSTLYTALSISYEYLTNATKRKITWSLSL